MPITREQAIAELERRGVDWRSELARRQAKQNPSSFQEIRDLKGLSPFQKAWQGLKVPEEMSRRGLTDLAQKMPSSVTGNLPRDIAVNTPRIATETLAQVAPGFVSRGAILTAGALKGLQKAAPAISAMRKGMFSQLESSSGSVPGSLEGAYQDPTLIKAEGRQVARPFYKAASEELKGKQVWHGDIGSSGSLEMEEGGRNVFKSMPENIRIVRRARQMIDSGGVLEPSEALTARKAADALKNSKAYSKDFLIELRRDLDAMAKSSKNIATAYPIHARGVMAESLRNILPQNKYGGASAFKMGIAPALTGIGGLVGGQEGAMLGGGLAAGALSPVVQGAGATALGMGTRAAQPVVQNPKLGALIVAILKSLRNRQGYPSGTGSADQ